MDNFVEGLSVRMVIAGAEETGLIQVIVNFVKDVSKATSPRPLSSFCG